MEAILVYPGNIEQLNAVKAALNDLKVRFEPQTSAIPEHVAASINKSIKQYGEGHTISLSEFAEKHFSKR